MGFGSDEELLESEKVNVVPLADLTLVLLIILMVLGPMVSRSMIRVSTPEIQKQAGVETAEEDPLVILLTGKGWRLDGLAVDRDTLGPALRTVFSRSPDRAVVVASAGEVPVDEVVRAVDVAKLNGARRVALARSGE